MAFRKTFRLSLELFFIIGFSLLLALIIAVDKANRLHFFRVALGLPFILFFPGYTLAAALFPKQSDLDSIERVALSFGLSIAVVPLVGLGLNYTPWGIRLTPILVALILFICAMSALALYRRSRLPFGERFIPTFEVNLPAWSELTKLDKVLSLILILAILFAVGSIFYVITTPKVGEKFTEFYILGTGGKAEGYPRELAPGEKGWVVVGIVNHEYGPIKYYVEVVAGGHLKKRLGPVELAHEEKWEEKVDFAVGQPQENLKIEFLLYREGDKEPYRSLHLWVNVRG